MELAVVPIVKPDAANFIFGQSHFIKTVEACMRRWWAQFLASASDWPSARPPVSGWCRRSGNNEAAVALARDNALALGAGHTFLIFLGDGFSPVNVLAAVRAVPEVCRIYCATADPTEVIVAQTELDRGVLGVVDGASPLGIETDPDIAWPKYLMRKIGYKLQWLEKAEANRLHQPAATSANPSWKLFAPIGRQARPSWYENSNGLAVNQGRADRNLGLAIGVPVEIVS
jgi:adenosine/AMP kinase